jgi:hypothetical protein
MDGNACDYSATELARDLVAGRLTVVEVTHACLELT